MIDDYQGRQLGGEAVAVPAYSALYMFLKIDLEWGKKGQLPPPHQSPNWRNWYPGVGTSSVEGASLSVTNTWLNVKG